MPTTRCGGCSYDRGGQKSLLQLAARSGKMRLCSRTRSVCCSGDVHVTAYKRWAFLVLQRRVWDEKATDITDITDRIVAGKERCC